MTATAYDVIEAIETDGIGLSVNHSPRSGWTIKATGTLTDNHRMLIGAFRADVVDLLGVRKLAACRMCEAISYGTNTKAIRGSFRDRHAGDRLRAFDAGWPDDGESMRVIG